MFYISVVFYIVFGKGNAMSDNWCVILINKHVNKYTALMKAKILEIEIGILYATLEDHKGWHPWNWLQRIVNLEIDNKKRESH